MAGSEMRARDPAVSARELHGFSMSRPAAPAWGPAIAAAPLLAIAAVAAGCAGSGAGGGYAGASGQGGGAAAGQPARTSRQAVDLPSFPARAAAPDTPFSLPVSPDGTGQLDVVEAPGPDGRPFRLVIETGASVSVLSDAAVARYGGRHLGIASIALGLSGAQDRRCDVWRIARRPAPAPCVPSPAGRGKRAGEAVSEQRLAPRRRGRRLFPAHGAFPGSLGILFPDRPSILAR